MWGNRRKSSGLIGKTTVVLGFCVAVLAVAVLYAPASAQQPEISGEPISYDHLENKVPSSMDMSLETEHPLQFLHFGKPITRKSHPKIFRATRKFPDLESCLSVTGNNEDLTKRKLDWPKIHAIEELDVCIFWIADALQNENMVKNWMENNGFGGFTQFVYSTSIMRLYNYAGDGHYINGGILRADIRMRLGWLEMLGVDSMSTGIVLDADHHPLSVRSNLSRM